MSESPQEFWKKALTAQPECLSPDHFSSGLSTEQERHLASCPRCQAEQALWVSFVEGMPAGEEAGAVRWVAAETERRLNPKPAAAKPWFAWLGSRTWAAGLAAAVVVIAVGYYASMPGVAPIPKGPGITDTYRSGSVQVVAPKGDLAAAPAQLVWEPVAGAASYHVSILEVDGKELWSGDSAAASVELPSAVRAKLVPGKGVMWKVTAKNATGGVVAESGSEAFRVQP